MEKIFNKILSLVLCSLVFIFPFFFLPLTQEYFVTNKLYLLAFVCLLLLAISTIKLLVTKKISWQKLAFDNLVLLFVTTVAISTLFSSPNKVQALLNPNFGLVMMISLTILYFYLSRINIPSTIYHLSSIILSLVAIVFFFQPFKNVALPQLLAFLKSPAFTPIGSQLDLAIFLGFFVVYQLTHLITTKQSDKQEIKQSILNYSIFTVNLLALFLIIYSLVKPVGTDVINHVSTLILPPFRLSWFAVLEVLKNPQTAIIGIGPDNFSAIFTRVKDFAYNQSPLWQINAFNVSRSSILQIFTETGIFGLLAFGLLIFTEIKSAFVKTTADGQLVKGDHKGSPLQLISFLYLLICLLIFPTSLIIWFLFFVVLAQLSRTDVINHVSTINLADLLPIYIGTVVISFGLIAGGGYLLGRSYSSEYYFKKSLEGINNNNIQQVYDNQRQAIILNPYIERFRTSFAQTNLLIANNVSKIDPKKITENDRQTITQAIQTGIVEGKAVISLNPQKADGWQNLASIYLNVINAAEGADVWTISAYQRAVLADPQNPTYRVGLGGVYYFLKKYDDALRFFEEAIAMKPDWPNASYNYAWTNFQKENYPQAVNAMQNTLNLLNPKLNKADYDKVQKELTEFKKKLPVEEKEATQSAETETGSLNLPTPPTTQISPKLELPKEASPEAK